MDDIAVVWADQPRVERKRLDKVLAAALRSELGRLTALRSGEPWNDTIFQVACNLVEFANSPHYDYSLESARDDFLNNAPRDGRRYTQQALERFWTGMVVRQGSKCRPYPVKPPEAVEPDLQFNYVPRGERA